MLVLALQVEQDIFAFLAAFSGGDAVAFASLPAFLLIVVLEHFILRTASREQRLRRLLAWIHGNGTVSASRKVCPVARDVLVAYLTRPDPRTCTFSFVLGDEVDACAVAAARAFSFLGFFVGFTLVSFGRERIIDEGVPDGTTSDGEGSRR